MGDPSARDAARQSCEAVPREDARADSIERWYREYHERLRLFCIRRLGDEAAADDVAQETLLRAWTRRDTFEPGADIAPWLFRVARNLCTDHLRARSRLIHTISLPEEASFDDDPVERAEMSAMVRTALAGLNERQRQILMARDVDGVDYPELARRMGLSEESARAVLCRARRGLRKRFLAVARATAALGLWPLIKLREMVRRQVPSETVAAVVNAGIGFAAVVALVVVPGVLTPPPSETPRPEVVRGTVEGAGSARSLPKPPPSEAAASPSSADGTSSQPTVRVSGDRRGELRTRVTAPNPATGEDADVWANVWREQDEEASVILGTGDQIQDQTCANATSACEAADTLLAGTEGP